MLAHRYQAAPLVIHSCNQCYRNCTGLRCWLVGMSSVLPEQSILEFLKSDTHENDNPH